MHFKRTTSSRKLRNWTAATESDNKDPEVRKLGSGFWECILHHRGQFFRGLADNARDAKSRAYSLSGKPGVAREA